MCACVCVQSILTMLWRCQNISIFAGLKTIVSITCSYDLNMYSLSSYEILSYSKNIKRMEDIRMFVSDLFVSFKSYYNQQEEATNGGEGAGEGGIGLNHGTMDRNLIESTSYSFPLLLWFKILKFLDFIGDGALTQYNPSSGLTEVIRSF